MHADVKKIHEQMESLGNVDKETNKNVDVIRDELCGITTEIQSANKSIDNFKNAEFKEVSDRVKELGICTENVHDDVKQIHEQIENLGIVDQETNKNICGIHDELSGITNEIRSLNDFKTNEFKQVGDRVKELGDFTENVHNDVKKVHEQIENLGNVDQETNKNICGIQDELTGITNEIRSLNDFKTNEFKQVGDRVKELGDFTENVKDKVKKIYEQMDVLGDIDQETNKNIDVINNELCDVIKKMNQFHDSLENLTSENIEKLGNLNLKVQELSTNVDNIHACTKTIDSFSHALKTRVDSLDEITDRLETKELNDLSQKIDSLDTSLADLSRRDIELEKLPVIPLSKLPSVIPTNKLENDVQKFFRDNYDAENGRVSIRALPNLLQKMITDLEIYNDVHFSYASNTTNPVGGVENEDGYYQRFNEFQTLDKFNVQKNHKGEIQSYFDQLGRPIDSSFTNHGTCQFFFDKKGCSKLR